MQGARLIPVTAELCKLKQEETEFEDTWPTKDSVSKKETKSKQKSKANCFEAVALT